MKTGSRDFYGKGVAAVREMRGHLEIFRVAEGMNVFIAEAGHFSSIKILHLNREKYEMMAKFRDDAFGLQISCIDEKLNGIFLSKVPFSPFLKRDSRRDVKT